MARPDPGKLLLAGVVLIGGYVLWKNGTLSKIGIPTGSTAAGVPGVPTIPTPLTIPFGVPGIQSTQFGIFTPVVAAPAQNGMPPIFASPEGALSAGPYTLTDAQGNPTPGAT